MTSDGTPRLISDMRGVRYGEVLAVFERGDGFEAEVYGTQMLNDCPQEVWEALDASAIAGLSTRRIATVDLGQDPSTRPYVERHVNRGAVFFFDAGAPVHELLDPDGLAYVMQAYCVGVDPTLTEADLPALGDRLDLPEGWSYRTRVLDEELVVDTTATIATVLQDELENTYTLPH